MTEETKQKVRQNHAKYWKGKKMSVDSNKKRRDSLKGKKAPWYGKNIPMEIRKKMSLSHLGKSHTLETRKKISDSLKGRKKKNVTSEETKEKRRKIRLQQIDNNFGGPNFNVKACNFINDLNKKCGWNLIHALNGKEKWLAGYAVDGYDKEKNIVFEYDEKHHYYVANDLLKPRDVLRQNEIIEKIKPFMFIRYNENKNKLYDVISGKELCL